MNIIRVLFPLIIKRVMMASIEQERERERFDDQEVLSRALIDK
jgi:hypothetical protein